MTSTTEILRRIDALEKPEKPRTYLGASSIGHPCSRWLWYQFHHAAFEVHTPRVRRLFKRGHREEDVFVEHLRGIGMEVWETMDGVEQWGVIDFDGHFRGHMDGVGKFPGEDPVVLEFKTMKAEKFAAVEKRGVKIAEPKYYAQAQIYMQGMKMKRELFCAVNKNDDSLYFEYVEFDPAEYNKLNNKAWQILNNENPPMQISSNPETFECRYCAARDVCHNGQAADKNCRSCRFGEPAPDSAWICTKGKTFGTVCPQWEDVTKPRPAP